MLRWDRIVGPPDFPWLTKAMDECDAEAAWAPAPFATVIPLTSFCRPTTGLAAKSLNDIGNAIRKQSEMLDGLNAASLRIATEQYEFNMRDEKTNAIYKWTPSVGVKKFLIPDAGQVTEFKVQFTTKQKTDAAAWGAVFRHRKGTCYWVNAIIGN